MNAVILDIDGVLLPIALPPPTTHWPAWRTHPERGDLVVAPDMIAEIDALDATVVWLTSWAANANEIVSPFVGWSARPTLEKRTVSEWWKLSAVERFVSESVPDRVAWIDDDLDQQSALVDERLGPHVKAGRLLLVCPDRMTGLSRADLTAVRGFFESEAS